MAIARANFTATSPLVTTALPLVTIASSLLTTTCVEVTMTCAVVTTACVEVTITCAVVTITCVEVTTAFALARTTCAEVTRSGQLMQRYRCFDAKVGVSRSKLDKSSSKVGGRSLPLNLPVTSTDVC